MADKNSTSESAASSLKYATNLLSSLANLRAQGTLLDVTLKTDGREFPVHKVVLASCSEVFREMFTGDTREVIELECVTAKGLEGIIQAAYSGEVTLDLDCVRDVLEAAVFLQMAPLVEICKEFLESTPSDQKNLGQIATPSA